MNAVQLVQDPSSIPPAPLEGVPKRCLNCVKEAFESLRSFFHWIGISNLIGCTAVVLVFMLVSEIMGAIAASLFVVAKIAEKIFRTVEAPPALPVLPRLPEGSVRSRYHQSNIANHAYNLEGHPVEVVEALQRPIPFHHNMLCCAITATIINFFYEHGFQALTPIFLDALLARGIRVDQAVRAHGELGNHPIDVDEFFQNIEDELPHVGFNAGGLPLQIQIQNEASFHQILNQFPQDQRSAGFLFPLTHRGHFTGLYREANGQFYVSESRNRFLNNIQYDGANQGAIVFCLGNTIEGAARNFAQLYPGIQQITFYPTIAQ